MPDFSHTGSGGLELIGCVDLIETTIFVFPAFAVGDFAWIKQRARRGVLERVSIKKINFIDQFTWNYQDSFNRLWLEKEFVDLATAEQLVQAFKVTQHARYVSYLKNCQSEIL